MRVIGRPIIGRAEVDDIATDAAVREYLWSLQYTIAAGTSQIQRNLIAERLLGLPRGSLSVDRWTFGEEPLAETTELAAVLRRVTALALAMEAPTRGSRELIETLGDAERALADAVPAVAAAARRRRTSTATGACTSTTPATSGRSTRASPTYELVVDGDTATGTVDVPDRLRGPAGPRARRVPRRVLRLRHPAPQLRRRRGRQDHQPRAPLPAADAAAHRADVRDRARRRPTTASSRPPGCSTTATVCAEAQMRAVRRRSRDAARRCRPGGSRRDVAHDRRRRRPPAHDRRAAAGPRGRTRRRDPCWSATTTRSPTATPTPDRPSSPGRCWRPASGKGTHVGLLLPNGADFVVAWLAAARIGAVTLPFSTFSTPTELAGLLARRRRRGAPERHRLPLARYADTLPAAIAELDLVGAAAAAGPVGPDAALDLVRTSRRPDVARGLDRRRRCSTRAGVDRRRRARRGRGRRRRRRTAWSSCTRRDPRARRRA